MADQVGGRLIKEVFSRLLDRCEDNHLLRHCVAQQMKEMHDRHYKYKKFRKYVLDRHWIDGDIDAMDDVQHRANFRLGRVHFNQVLAVIKDHPSFVRSKFANDTLAISTKDRLYMCLYHIATGASFHAVAETFGVGDTTVFRAVYTVTG